jgi:hypothetical protein
MIENLDKIKIGSLILDNSTHDKYNGEIGIVRKLEGDKIVIEWTYRKSEGTDALDNFTIKHDSDNPDERFIVIEKKDERKYIDKLMVEEL